jgi:hypothetical protein
LQVSHTLGGVISTQWVLAYQCPYSLFLLLMWCFFLQILTLSKIPDVLSKRAEIALGTAFVTTLLNLFVLGKHLFFL